MSVGNLPDLGIQITAVDNGYIVTIRIESNVRLPEVMTPFGPHQPEHWETETRIFHTSDMLLKWLGNKLGRFELTARRITDA